MSRPKHSRWHFGLAFLPVIAAVLLQFWGSDLQTGIRNALFDQYQRWQPRTYIPTPVRIIDIDEDSLQRLGQWPWPRSRVAQMVERLAASEVAAIGFDVMFAEPDRTSPKAVTQLWPLSSAQRQEILALPDHDQMLARSFQATDAVLGIAAQQSFFGDDAGQSHPAEPPTPLIKARFVQLGEPQLQWLPQFSHLTSVLPPLELAAKGLGALNFVPDRDGVVRRVPLVLQGGGITVPTLVSETLRVAQGAPFMVLRSAGHMNGLSSSQDHAGLGEIRIGDAVIPTTASGEMWIHYTRQQTQRSVPAWRLFEGEVPLTELAGHIVLVGSSAAGLMDLRFSPLGLMPGVQAHAQAMEQILNGQFLERPSWARGLELTVLMALGLGIGVLALRIRAVIAALACVGLIGVLIWAGWYGFSSHGLLLDVALPAWGVMLTFVVCSLAHHLASEREQRWVKEAFSRYVSPNRVSHLIDHPDDMALGGRRQECSFIFTDLAGFTQLMEKIDPAEAVSLLNGYLDELIAIAFRHEGTLDRIVGDAVAIMFSAPVLQVDHRKRALACALEMNAFAERYSQAQHARGVKFGPTRIGVHAGEVIVGNFGGTNIFDYRALGDPINTASRLESVNKHLGTRICISQVILDACPDVPVRPIGQLVLKGKRQALKVYEPETGLEYRAPRVKYLNAYQAMTSNASQAKQLFEALAQDYPLDPLVQFHTRRLQSLQADSMSLPGDLIVMNEK